MIYLMTKENHKALHDGKDYCIEKTYQGCERMKYTTFTNQDKLFVYCPECGCVVSQEEKYCNNCFEYINWNEIFANINEDNGGCDA